MIQYYNFTLLSLLALTTSGVLQEKKQLQLLTLTVRSLTTFNLRVFQVKAALSKLASALKNATESESKENAEAGTPQKLPPCKGIRSKHLIVPNYIQYNFKIQPRQCPLNLK